MKQHTKDKIRFWIGITILILVSWVAMSTTLAMSLDSKHDSIQVTLK